MRTLAWAFTVAALVLGLVVLAALARAQPSASYATRELLVAAAGAITVDTAWSTTRSGRTARVTATLAGHERRMFDGATVRTAAAARDDALAVVVFHGGDAPFARVLVAQLEGGRIEVPVPVELDRSAARARSATLRPAAAVVASTGDGFAVLLQEQESDPTADVVTTLTRLDAAGAILEATHAVGVPWQLAALLGRDDGGYELAVLYGSGSSPDEARARACIVSLGATGEPTEHPWWASGDDAYAEVRLLRAPSGELVVAWRGRDETTISATRWTADGGWGAAPADVTMLGSVGPGEPFALASGDGDVTIVTP